MKKTMIFFVSFVLMIFLVQIANAANVGIVVEFPDSSVKTDCVSVDASTSGYDILQQSRFDVSWIDYGAPFGHFICKIDGVGGEGTSCNWDSSYYWAFYTLDMNSWDYSQVGLDTYSAEDKDVLGFARNDFSSTKEPPLKTYEQVCEKLSIKNIKVYVDGDKESGADEDGGKIDAAPGSKIELKIELENLYTTDEDIDINDIVVEGTLEDIDEGDDIEDYAKEFNLKAEKDKEVSLEFNIPLEVEEDDYDLNIEVEGTDDYNIRYKRTVSFTVEVEKKKHNIIINKAVLTNNNLKCSRTTKLDIEVINLGAEKEDVNLEIINPELGINIKEDFNLDNGPFDEESKFKKTYLITIPNEQREGEYPLKISAACNNKNKEKTIKLTIEDCEKIEEENNPEITGSAVENLEVEENQVTITQAPSNEKPVSKNLTIFSILLTIQILILVAVIGFIVKHA